MNVSLRHDSSTSGVTVDSSRGPATCRPAGPTTQGGSGVNAVPIADQTVPDDN